MKKLTALLLALLCLCSLAACGAPRMTFDIPEANMVHLVSALTGSDASIVDGEFVAQITDNLNSIEFVRKGKPDAVGCAYIIEWLDTDWNILAGVMVLDKGGTQILYDGYVWEGRNGGCVDTQLIEKAFAWQEEHLPGK